METCPITRAMEMASVGVMRDVGTWLWLDCLSPVRNTVLIYTDIRGLKIWPKKPVYYIFCTYSVHMETPYNEHRLRDFRLIFGGAVLE